MQTLFEAANHIAQEIERTGQHLINLAQALDGLKPLITVEAATLTYTITSRGQAVEDLSVVNATAPAKRKAKSKSPVETRAEKTKAAKVKAVAAKEVAPEAAAEPAKLPATGAGP